MRLFWIALGGVLVLLGIAGLILPLVPGIPFLVWGIAILAGYFVYARWLRMKIKKIFGRILPERFKK
ncbi:MAG: hypothetical protein HYT22_01285 [Candidatus Niyogibacteria bacterium]|nr:hypothetical protein [Candidatus Niyogibacteria bacterium]